MANGATAPVALHKAIAAGLPVGLHINLTEGVPLTGAKSSLCVPAAADDKGVSSSASHEMRGKFGFREAVTAGLIALPDLQAEIRAQMLAFKATHPSQQWPQHLDGHQHVHVLPEVAPIIISLAEELGLPLRVRLPFLSPELEDCTHLPAGSRAFYEQVSSQAKAAEHLFAAAGFHYPTAFVGFSTMGANSELRRVQGILERVVAAAVTAPAAASAAVACMAGGVESPKLAGQEEAAVAQRRGKGGGTLFGVVEWMVHPGRVRLPDVHGAAAASNAAASNTAGSATGSRVSSASLVSAGCGCGPDEFSLSAERDVETALLCGEELKAILLGMSLELTSLGKAAAELETL